MAHEIYTTATGKASMAFVGQTPWHGMGQRLTKDATIEEWKRESGLDWEALTAPVEFTRADGSKAVYSDKKVIYRGDTGAPLSAMGEGYQLVQPGACLEFFRDVVRDAGWYVHTAGSLDGGRKFWAMASRGHSAEVVPGDSVRENMLFATALDGSSATVVGETAVRVVCANTWKEAIRGGLKGYKGKGAGARVTHRSVFDAEAVKRELGMSADIFGQQIATAQRLAAQAIGTDEARDLLRELFGQPKVKAAAQAEAARVIATAKGDTLAALLSGPHIPRDHAASEREGRDLLAGVLSGGDIREQKSVARCLALFGGEGRGANHPGVAGTRWGLFNAVTEHIDHEQGRDGTRLDAAWFGRGADFKAEALALLTA